MSQTIGRGVDQARQAEQKAQRRETSASALTGTRYWWLQGRERHARWSGARAALRAAASGGGADRSGAETQGVGAVAVTGPVSGQVEADCNRWIRLAQRSGLPAMARAGEIIRRHLGDAPNAILFRVTSARSESISALIQRAKRNAWGYRNWERFRASVLLLCGD